MAKRTAVQAHTFGAAEFKARCLELIEKVNESRAEYTITRHGKPVARLVPVQTTSARRSVFGCMRGTVLEYERPFDPIDGTSTCDAPNVPSDDTVLEE